MSDLGKLIFIWTSQLSVYLSQWPRSGKILSYTLQYAYLDVFLGALVDLEARYERFLAGGAGLSLVVPLVARAATHVDRDRRFLVLTLALALSTTKRTS